jgi:hypothetical protein
MCDHLSIFFDFCHSEVIDCREIPAVAQRAALSHLFPERLISNYPLQLQGSLEYVRLAVFFLSPHQSASLVLLHKGLPVQCKPRQMIVSPARYRDSLSIYVCPLDDDGVRTRSCFAFHGPGMLASASGRERIAAGGLNCLTVLFHLTLLGEKQSLVRVNSKRHTVTIID